MTGWKLNIHCPLTEVMSGTVCTVGTDATLVLVVVVTLVLLGELEGCIRGVVTVFTRLFAATVIRISQIYVY